jgi:hypothetical protein
LSLQIFDKLISNEYESFKDLNYINSLYYNNNKNINIVLHNYNLITHYKFCDIENMYNYLYDNIYTKLHILVYNKDFCNKFRSFTINKI